MSVACATGCSGQTSPDPSIDAIAKVLPAIVKIEAIQLRSSDGRLVKSAVGGSGVIIDTDGHVLTNFHVAEDADFFRCYLTDGAKVDAKRVGQDPLTDLAVLKIDAGSRPKDAKPLPTAVFADSDGLVTGDVVFAIGSPGFLTQSVTRGVVSNPSAVLPEETGIAIMMRGENVGSVVRWILHDARIYRGNSGGPLVNARGEVVGINEIGVFNLGGAIPGNLAHAIAEQLIASGRVARGWSGITAQPRLEADGDGDGVRVADVAPGSPAAKAGIGPGDMLMGCNGKPINDRREKAVAQFYRFEMTVAPGGTLVLDRSRGAARDTVRLELVQREAAESENVELKPWGVVGKDVTAQFARIQGLPDTRGVWLDSVRPSGSAGQADPRMLAGDVLIVVDDKPVANVADLRSVTEDILKKAPRGVRTVIATLRRGHEEITSVARLRRSSEPTQIVPEVRKGWLGVATQPLTVKLAAHLHIESQGGVRVTQVYGGTRAEEAGLKIGDIILALDGDPVIERRQEDTDLFTQQIRQYSPGTSATLSLWRAGSNLKIPVTIEEEPQPVDELPKWEDAQLEFTVRVPAFEDRVRLQLESTSGGVLVAAIVPSGWAELAGLRADDIIVRSDDHPVNSPDELQRMRDEAVHRGDHWWVLMVRRRAATLFIEINLKPATS